LNVNIIYKLLLDYKINYLYDHRIKTKIEVYNIFRWYHGRLDRFTAEERLWDASKMGSYLVRESDRKPGSYVLSYLGRTGINHFRITAVCGDYYIGKVFELYIRYVNYTFEFLSLSLLQKYIYAYNILTKNLLKV